MRVLHATAAAAAFLTPSSNDYDDEDDGEGDDDDERRLTRFPALDSSRSPPVSDSNARSIPSYLYDHTSDPFLDNNKRIISVSSSRLR